MNRRAFVTGLGAVLAAPLAAEAQQAKKIRRLGVLIAGSPETTTSEVEAFRQGLRDFGYVDGQNLAIEYRYGYGRSERASTFVGEFIRMNVDVIVAAGGPMALTVKNLTQTIPIVFVAAGDPVHYGIVMSLARPGGNTTGLALPVDTDFIEKWMQLLKEAAPAIARIGFIEDLNMRLPKRPAIREVGVRRIDVRDLADIGSAFAKLSNEHGGVIVPPQSFFFTYQRDIATLAAKHRLPAIYGFRGFVESGGLMSYGLSLPGAWRQAASYVDKILKGAKPADLPVEQPTKFELVINLKTAKALGLTIPQSLLLRADQVIE